MKWKWNKGSAPVLTTRPLLCSADMLAPEPVVWQFIGGISVPTSHSSSQSVILLLSSLDGCPNSINAPLHGSVKMVPSGGDGGNVLRLHFHLLLLLLLCLSLCLLGFYFPPSSLSLCAVHRQRAIGKHMHLLRVIMDEWLNDGRASHPQN